MVERERDRERKTAVCTHTHTYAHTHMHHAEMSHHGIISFLGKVLTTDDINATQNQNCMEINLLETPALTSIVICLPWSLGVNPGQGQCCDRCGVEV